MQLWGLASLKFVEQASRLETQAGPEQEKPCVSVMRSLASTSKAVGQQERY